MDFKGVIFYTL